MLLILMRTEIVTQWPTYIIAAHSWIQHRCFPNWYREAVRGLNLTQVHVDLILSTPFGHLLNFPYMNVDNQLIDDLCYNYLENETFKIGGVVVSLTTSNIIQILGLPNGPLQIKSKDEKVVETNNFKNRLFGNVKIALKRDDIVNKKQNLLEDNTKDNTKDIVKLWILLLLASLLLPQFGYTLSSHLIGYIEANDPLDSYNWADTIKHKLFANMKKCSEVVRKRKAGEKATSYLTGCTMALCVSFFYFVYLMQLQFKITTDYKEKFIY